MPAALDLLNRSIGLIGKLFGTTPFFWAGHALAGDLGPLDEAYDLQEQGKVLRVSSTLFAPIAQFAGIGSPKKGQTIKVGAETYEIAHAAGDSLGFTLYLGADIRSKV